MNYERLQIQNGIDKWDVEKVQHLEEGIIRNEDTIAIVAQKIENESYNWKKIGNEWWAVVADIPNNQNLKWDEISTLYANEFLDLISNLYNLFSITLDETTRLTTLKNSIIPIFDTFVNANLFSAESTTFITSYFNEPQPYINTEKIMLWKKNNVYNVSVFDATYRPRCDIQYNADLETITYANIKPDYAFTDNTLSIEGAAADAKAVSDAISKMNISQVNADWNQNDTEAKDYIKNRTHYFWINKIKDAAPDGSWGYEGDEENSPHNHLQVGHDIDHYNNYRPDDFPFYEESFYLEADEIIDPVFITNESLIKSTRTTEWGSQEVCWYQTLTKNGVEKYKLCITVSYYQPYYYSSYWEIIDNESNFVIPKQWSLYYAEKKIKTLDIEYLPDMTADWSELDKTSPSYIKNKPFESVVSYGPLQLTASFPEDKRELTSSNGELQGYNIFLTDIDTVYTVRVNGEDYEANLEHQPLSNIYTLYAGYVTYKCWLEENGWVATLERLFTSEVGKTPEHVSIYRGEAYESIKTLSLKYIPELSEDKLPKTVISDWNEKDPYAFNHIRNKPFDSRIEGNLVLAVYLGGEKTKYWAYEKYETEEGNLDDLVGYLGLSHTYDDDFTVRINGVNYKTKVTITGSEPHGVRIGGGDLPFQYHYEGEEDDWYASLSYTGDEIVDTIYFYKGDITETNITPIPEQYIPDTIARAPKAPLDYVIETPTAEQYNALLDILKEAGIITIE